MSTSFTEADVEGFFDQTTQTYLSFWDSEGVLHTGYFAGEDDQDYRAAAQRTSDILATDAGITAESYVLDVGCGCGNFLLHLAEHYGCRGEGLDLSIERVKFAQAQLTGDRAALNLNFTHGSATKMPYPDGTFSHVVSQDALFLVPDKPRSHAEVFRVLQDGGIFAFSDFLQPTKEIGERARTHVYDRVRWSEGYSFLDYQAALAAGRLRAAAGPQPAQPYPPDLRSAPADGGAARRDDRGSRGTGLDRNLCRLLLGDPGGHRPR